MKALSYLPPWGTLQVHGRKLIETRTWAPTDRTLRPGDLFVVHHSQAWDDGDRHKLETVFTCSHTEHGFGVDDWGRIGSALSGLGYGESLKLPLGSLLGVMRYLGALKTEELLRNRDRYDLTDDEKAFGNYSTGRKGWLTESVLILPTPIPARGAQGLWNVPAEAEAEITALLLAAGVELSPPREAAAPLGLDTPQRRLL